MYLFALALTLLGSLSIARRLVEPPCPACSSKRWSDEPKLLQCTACGWSNVALAMATNDSGQYEITLPE